MATSDRNPQRAETGTQESLGQLGDAALIYARNDIPVFPVWNPTEDGGCACPRGLDCPHPGKHPITRRGFKDASTDPDIVRMWWTRHPRANIGMATGSESGLLVIDVDSGKEGFENLAALIHCYGEWPQTPTVRTGGEGMHFYFRYPDNAEIRNDVGKKLGPGIDVRGEGGYVLLPPSVHATRRVYEWVEDESG